MSTAAIGSGKNQKAGGRRPQALQAWVRLRVLSFCRIHHKESGVDYRRLGRSGLKVSEVCLGSWLTFGGATEDATAAACIDKALELGINFFDTANVYAAGKAEEVVGRALRKHRRDDYVVATKVYFPMGPGPNDKGLSRKHIREQCEASLKRLGLDYIDLYQCHRYDAET